MIAESWVVYVDLRTKNADADAPGDGVDALHNAHASMTDDGWTLVSTLPDNEHGTTAGAWLFFEREATTVEDEIEEAVATLDVEERRALMDEAVHASDEPPTEMRR